MISACGYKKLFSSTMENVREWPISRLARSIQFPAYTTSRWQLEVDTIYRALSCDLIGVKPFIGPYDEKSFLRAIRTLDPLDRARKSIALWNGTSIYGTERLSELCGHYFPATGGYDGTLNPPFVEALEQIYAENGVPWSDKPLLPIVPDRRGGPPRPLMPGKRGKRRPSVSSAFEAMFGGHAINGYRNFTVIDGETIKPLIGEDGRAPEAPDPAYPADPARRAGGRFHRRRAPLSAPQRPRS